MVQSTENVLSGVEKYFTEYNNSVEVDEKAMKAKIEAYMKAYDKRMERKMMEEKNTEEDDGWTKVTSFKKRGKHGTVRKESTLNRVVQNQEAKLKKKELVNFYAFQIRESKKQRLIELREKFELDKKRVEELKQQRKFKPY